MQLKALFKQIKQFGIHSLTVATVLFASAWGTYAHAWDATGHALVAQIAYDQVSPKVRQSLDKLTHALDPVYPVTNFVRAAAWPDRLRARGIRVFSDWHFVNQPYFAEAALLPTVQKKEDFKNFPEPNLIWAIEQSQNILQSDAANPFEKGLFLRFLSHFVGDIHQPMHCIELFDKRFPKGDRGGNLFVIKDRYADNLHKLWDRGAGSFSQASPHYPLKRWQIRRLAAQISHNYPPAYFGKRVKEVDPRVWAKESYTLAKDFAYSTELAKKPSAAYYKKAHGYVEQQVALAGYRLAYILTELFG